MNSNVRKYKYRSKSIVFVSARFEYNLKLVFAK